MRGRFHARVWTLVVAAFAALPAAGPFLFIWAPLGTVAWVVAWMLIWFALDTRVENRGWGGW